MRLAIYSPIDGSLLSVYKNINNPSIEGDLLVFTNGSFSGLTDYHILLDDDVVLPDTLEDARLLDKKAEYEVEKINETEELKKQLAETNELLLDFLESMLA